MLVNVCVLWAGDAGVLSTACRTASHSVQKLQAHTHSAAVARRRRKGSIDLLFVELFAKFVH